MRVLSTRGLGLRGYSQSFGITDWFPLQDLSHLRKSGQSTKDQQIQTRCSISASFVGIALGDTSESSAAVYVWALIYNPSGIRSFRYLVRDDGNPC